MRATTTYTSTLSLDMMNTLNDYAQRLKLPKSKIIETALSNYLDEIKRAEYARSFQRANEDPELLAMAEEGLDDYLEMLNQHEKQ